MGETKYTIAKSLFGGKIFEISHTAMTYKGENAILEIFHDITEQKIAEDKVRISQTKLTVILENLLDAYIQTDSSGNLIYINNTGVKLHGYSSSDEMIGLNINELYHDNKPKAKLSMLTSNLFESGMLSDYTCLASKKDKTSFWASLNIRLNFDSSGQVVGSEGVVRDISERMIAQNRIEQSEFRFKAIAEQAVDGIFVITLKGEFIFFNNSFYGMLGYNENEFKKLKFSDLYHKDHLSENKIIRFEENVNLRKKLVCKDQSSIIADISSKYITLNDERMILGMVRNITPQVEMENRIDNGKIKSRGKRPVKNCFSA
ncbi:MAG: PAS domain S-box protein [Bacteroidetes bacterium]|nr:PAS domain S-box protein [Bacteroidota bacterium]